jgi:hypothetical protein
MPDGACVCPGVLPSLPPAPSATSSSYILHIRLLFTHAWPPRKPKHKTRQFLQLGAGAGRPATDHRIELEPQQLAQKNYGYI